MLYCQSERLDHRARATHALTFVRDGGASPDARVLACHDHVTETDERYGLTGSLALSRVEEVFEESVVVPLTRRSLETSALSPITVAYDRACVAARDRGLAPVTTYRTPVTWQVTDRRAVGAELVEAHVTLAVTRAVTPPSPR